MVGRPWCSAVELMPTRHLAPLAPRIAVVLDHPARDATRLALALGRACQLVAADGRPPRVVADRGSPELRPLVVPLAEVDRPWGRLAPPGPAREAFRKADRHPCGTGSPSHEDASAGRGPRGDDAPGMRAVLRRPRRGRRTASSRSGVNDDGGRRRPSDTRRGSRLDRRSIADAGPTVPRIGDRTGRSGTVTDGISTGVAGSTAFFGAASRRGTSASSRADPAPGRPRSRCSSSSPSGAGGRGRPPPPHHALAGRARAGRHRGLARLRPPGRRDGRAPRLRDAGPHAAADRAAHPRGGAVGADRRDRGADRSPAPRRVVFDSLPEPRLISASMLRFRRAVLGLKATLARQNETILLIESHDGLSTVESTEPTTHRTVRPDWKTPEFGVTHRRLQVIEMRGIAFSEGYHDVTIARGGFVPPRRADRCRLGARLRRRHPRRAARRHAPSWAHDALREGDWRETSLGRAVGQAVEGLVTPGERHRIVREGPEIRLQGGQATSLRLILHELASNARRYGARPRRRTAASRSPGPASTSGRSSRAGPRRAGPRSPRRAGRGSAPPS